MNLKNLLTTENTDDTEESKPESFGSVRVGLCLFRIIRVFRGSGFVLLV